MLNSRRSFLAFAGALVAGGGSVARAQSSAADAPAADTPYADKSAMQTWMAQWMLAPKAADGPLHLGRFADPFYFLTREIGWKPNPGQEAHKNVRVPVRFVTDFASIPRVFWSLLPPDGLYTYPAIIHDYLYWEQSVSRDEADLILRFAMEDFKVDAVKIGAIYSGVRLGGWVAWNSNAKLKASGEKRVLKVLPEDPTARWEGKGGWRTRKDVF